MVGDIKPTDNEWTPLSLQIQFLKLRKGIRRSAAPIDLMDLESPPVAAKQLKNTLVEVEILTCPHKIHFLRLICYSQ